MRRRIRRKWQRRGRLKVKKPVSMDWMTSVVILLSGFLWYLLHLFSVNSLACERVIAWWFQREEMGLSTLQWASLLTMVLALWFCVVVIRPNLERVPLLMRGLQGVFIAFMVLISVLQWGLFRPQSDEGRFYAWFYEEVERWPVIGFFMPQRFHFSIYRELRVYDSEASPEIMKVRQLMDDFEGVQARKWQQAFVPRPYGRTHAVNGQYSCGFDAFANKWFWQIFEMEWKFHQQQVQEEQEAIDWFATPEQNAPSSGGDRPDG